MNFFIENKAGSRVITTILKKRASCLTSNNMEQKRILMDYFFKFLVAMPFWREWQLQNSLVETQLQGTNADPSNL